MFDFSTGNHSRHIVRYTAAGAVALAAGWHEVTVTAVSPAGVTAMTNPVAITAYARAPDAGAPQALIPAWPKAAPATGGVK